MQMSLWTMHEVFGSELDDSELEIEFNFAAEKYLSDYGHWAQCRITNQSVCHRIVC